MSAASVAWSSRWPCSAPEVGQAGKLGPMQQNQLPKQGKSAIRQAAVELLLSHRWAALATVDDEGLPAASMVAYALEAECQGILLHLSALAAHSSHLLARPHASLVVSAAEGSEDPQQLPRLSLNTSVEVLERDSDEYARARTLYLESLPDAEPLFGFGDFRLFRLRPITARYVGGFANAHTLDSEALAAGWRLLKAPS